MNKLGFGFLRLPRTGMEDTASIDWPLLDAMVDTFLAGGGTYFDTAYTYLDGMSEQAVRRSLVERHPRNAYCLADKLPTWKVKRVEDCEMYFQEQCARCGVEWFDVYLLHWLNPENYKIAERFREFDFLQILKARGRAIRTGFSYHGDAALLEEILMAHPEVDIVQLQINYLDWEDPAIEARACYETALRHGKQVVVMEPVKGGTLADLPEEAARLLHDMAPENSQASWALRFAQGLEQVEVVLSGMNTLGQLRDNLQPAHPLTDREWAALEAVVKILNRSIAVPCTACRYCVPHCPKGIAIPDFFRIFNSYCRHPKEGWKMQPVYGKLTQTHGKASDCIGCRMCEQNCPQRIPISAWLPKIAAAMED